MSMNNETRKSLQSLIIFTAVVTLAVIYFKTLTVWAVGFLNVIQPFLLGGVIAFVLNIPMVGIEKKLFGNTKGKWKRLARPCSILITFFLFIGVIGLILFAIIPQITNAVREQNLAQRIPAFLDQMWSRIQLWAQQYPFLQEKITQLQENKIDWDGIFQKSVDFLSNGVGSSVLVSTVSIAGNIIGGIVNALIAVVFSIYILSSKETLARQFKKLFLLVIKRDKTEKVLKILRLLSGCFSRFIIGQFTEAVILGCMFFVVLSIGRFPYALIISLLIGVMALVPIVGAFVGCFVGAFLILMENPLQAVWFVIIFLIIQQIEGNLIYPKVVGNSVGLPSIWVLVAVTVGGSMFGVVGMLAFIPIWSAVYTLLRENAAKTESLPISKINPEESDTKQKDCKKQAADQKMCEEQAGKDLASERLQSQKKVQETKKKRNGR